MKLKADESAPQTGQRGRRGFPVQSTQSCTHADITPTDKCTALCNVGG